MMRYPGSLRRPARAGLCCLAAVAVTAATVGAVHPRHNPPWHAPRASPDANV
jgi:hypothetical protein